MKISERILGLIKKNRVNSMAKKDSEFKSEAYSKAEQEHADALATYAVKLGQFEESMADFADQFDAWQQTEAGKGAEYDQQIVQYGRDIRNYERQLSNYTQLFGNPYPATPEGTGGSVMDRFSPAPAAGGEGEFTSSSFNTGMGGSGGTGFNTGMGGSGGTGFNTGMGGSSGTGFNTGVGGSGGTGTTGGTTGSGGTTGTGGTTGGTTGTGFNTGVPSSGGGTGFNTGVGGTTGTGTTTGGTGFNTGVPSSGGTGFNTGVGGTTQNTNGWDQQTLDNFRFTTGYDLGSPPQMPTPIASTPAPVNYSGLLHPGDMPDYNFEMPDSPYTKYLAQATSQVEPYQRPVDPYLDQYVQQQQQPRWWER